MIMDTRTSSRWWDVRLHPEQCATVPHDTPDHYHNGQIEVHAPAIATR